MAQKANSRQEEEFLKRFSLRKFTVPIERLKGRTTFFNRPKNNNLNLAQKGYRIEYKELKKALKIDVPWWLRTKVLERDMSSERLATLVEETKEKELITYIDEQQISMVYDNMTYISRAPSLKEFSYANKNSKIIGSPRKEVQAICDFCQKDETDNSIERRLSRVLRVLNSLEYARLDSGCEKCLNNGNKNAVDTLKQEYDCDNNKNNNKNNNGRKHTETQNSPSRTKNNFCFCDLEDVDMEIESLCVCLGKLLEDKCKDPCHYKDIIKRLKHIRKTLCEFMKKVASSEDNLSPEKLEKVEYFMKPQKHQRREIHNGGHLDVAPHKKEPAKDETDKQKKSCGCVKKTQGISNDKKQAPKEACTPEDCEAKKKPKKKGSTGPCGCGRKISSDSCLEAPPKKDNCQTEKIQDFCDLVKKTQEICNNDTTYPCLVLKQALKEACASEANNTKIKPKKKKSMGVCCCGKKISSDECVAEKEKAFCECVKKSQNISNKEPNYPCLDLNQAPTGQGTSFDLDECLPADNHTEIKHRNLQDRTKQISTDMKLCNCMDMEPCNEDEIEQPANSHGHPARNSDFISNDRVNPIQQKEDGKCCCAQKNSIIINIKEIYSLRNSKRESTRPNADYQDQKSRKNMNDFEDTRGVQQAEIAVDQQICKIFQNDSMAEERGQVKCKCEIPLKKEPSIAINRRIKIKQFNDMNGEQTAEAMIDDCKDEAITDVDTNQNGTEMTTLAHCDDRQDSVLSAQNGRAVKAHVTLNDDFRSCKCNENNEKADSNEIQIEPTIRICGIAKSKAAKHFKKQNLATKIDKGFSSKDFCYDCYGKDVPIIEKDLAGEIRKIIGNRKRNSVFLKLTVIKSNLYHMQMSTDKDYLGCLYATESATFEARNANGFDGYITLCVTDTENTLAQIECLVDHAFMVVQQEKSNPC